MQGGVVVTPFDRPKKNICATVGMIFGIVTISLFWLMIFNFIPVFQYGGLTINAFKDSDMDFPGIDMFQADLPRKIQTEKARL